MKNVLFVSVLLLSTLLFSQETVKEDDFNRNELHLNLLMPIALKSFEFEYERNISDQSGVGASVFIGNSDEWELRFAFTPFFRKYFGKEDAKGFFLEGFAMVNTIEYETYDYVYPFYYGNYKVEKETDLALGIGLGGKFIASDNFVGIINAGIGRNLLSDGGEEVIPRLGIHFGYSF